MVNHIYLKAPYYVFSTTSDCSLQRHTELQFYFVARKNSSQLWKPSYCSWPLRVTSSLSPSKHCGTSNGKLTPSDFPGSGCKQRAKRCLLDSEADSLESAVESRDVARTGAERDVLLIRKNPQEVSPCFCCYCKINKKINKSLQIRMSRTRRRKSVRLRKSPGPQLVVLF